MKSKQHVAIIGDNKESYAADANKAIAAYKRAERRTPDACVIKDVDGFVSFIIEDYGHQEVALYYKSRNGVRRSY